MHFGLAPSGMGMLGDARTLAEIAREAEEFGWDGFFLEDYVLHQTPLEGVIYDPWITLTAIAMRAERIRFGAMVTPLSRRRPWKVAREAVTLDHLSGGRLILGVGLGDENASDFADVGEVTDAKERARMLDEGIEILIGLWSGKPFSFNGEYYHIDNVTMIPPPLQTPRIPIWVGGFWPSKGPMRRAARLDGICAGKRNEDGSLDNLTVEEVRTVKKYIDERRTSTAPFDIVQGGTTPGDNPEAARNQLAPFVEAGVSWWVEFIGPENGTLDALRTRIRQGPPRLE